ncbi:MAG: hypothetical protein JXK16_04485 [Thiotrichales bacterium]|nr:hypothetical protein [Thiotrichales bacterium]
MKAYNLKTQKFNVTNGVEIDAIILGESGRGRRQEVIPCPDDGLENGAGVSVGRTQSGRPRINTAAKPEGAWLARIRTDGAYIRGADGNVRVLPNHAKGVELVAKGFGAFGLAGGVGNWDDVLVVVPDGTLIRVKPTRATASYLLFTGTDVLAFDGLGALQIYADSIGLELEGKPSEWPRF